MATTERDKPAEIEVTPAMIEAGVAELLLTESGDSPWATARAVFEAMRRLEETEVTPAMIEAGEEVISRASRHNPDWSLDIVADIYRAMHKTHPNGRP